MPAGRHHGIEELGLNPGSVSLSSSVIWNKLLKLSEYHLKVKMRLIVPAYLDCKGDRSNACKVPGIW